MAAECRNTTIPVTIDEVRRWLVMHPIIATPAILATGVQTGCSPMFTTVIVPDR